MTWTAGTLLKQTREGTWTYRIRPAYTNQVHLGNGGCGVTYLADCLQGEHQGKRVVIKTILDEHYSRPDFLQIKNDFWAEAFRLQRCIHSHIVQVWDLFQEPIVTQTIQTRASGSFLERLVGSTQNTKTTMTLEVPCMVQEYIQGESLYHRLWRKKTPLAEQEALKYIQQIGFALTVVHRQNMVHRDVKPENIMLREPEQEAVLIDFGLVRPITIKRHTEGKSPGYAPPEQYLDETDRDATLDVYALAATLYVLVTGLDPVGDTRLVESKLRGSEQHMGRPDPLKRPEYWNPSISSQVADAIWQGMQLLPGDRPPTIAAWLDLMGLSLENDRSSVLIQPPPSTPTWSDPLPAPIVNPPRTQKTVPAYSRLSPILLTPSIPSPNSNKLTLNLKPKRGGNPVPLELLPIPGGSFWMGQTDAETKQLKKEAGEDIYKQFFEWELPRHRVTVPPFWMGRYPVTQAQYEAVMGENPTKGKAWVYDGSQWQPNQPIPKKFLGDDKPVIGVSWDMAVKFCEALNKQFQDYQFRLPTEAEWEYACRAGTETAFYFGDRLEPHQANYGCNQSYNGSKTAEWKQVTTPVGQFPANAWGLQDMHGNVWEWCADQWYDSYKKKPQKLKDNGSIPWTKDSSTISPSIDIASPLRGGSWSNNPRDCRAAQRNRNNHNNANNNVGVRVVCVARTS